MSSNNVSRKKVLKRKIESNEQNEYIEVKFDLPNNVEKMAVSMVVNSSNIDQTVIDLGVRDSYRVRGWSGGARKKFYITEEHATPGYLSGQIHGGEWAVLLGAYRVSKEGCEVALTVDYELKSSRWLNGDLHLHSVHSDGSYTLDESIKIAKENELDFIALTDHNTVSQNLTRPKNTDITLIPGIELTTNQGHLNFLGADDPIMDFRVNSDDDLALRLKEARKAGASITFNHPFCRYTGWHWDWDFDYDFVEVWNGPWREDNNKALQWWHNQLVEGKRLVAISGSDTHRPEKYRKHGMPTTWVYSKSKSVHDILESIHKGHVVMTYKHNAPFIVMRSGDNIIGDICASTNESTEILVNNLNNKDIVKIYSQSGLELEDIVNGSEAEKKYELINHNRLFYRVEVWRYIAPFENPLLVSLSNPIYFEQ